MGPRVNPLDGARKRIRVAIVDDHAVVRDGTAALLEREADIEVVGLADSLESASTLLSQDLDVIVLDIRIGDENGFAFLRDTSRAGRPVVVIQSAFDYPQYIEAAVRLGAAGYVLKTDPFRTLVDAIRKVAAGGMAYSVRPSRAARRPLSAREREVVRQVVDGLSNDEIAGRLGISPKTVESHLTRIYALTDVASRTELATLAMREGWMETTEG
jgi:DNA-binding NarL/FixJ family response regulator